jgi:hypothetical protein
MDVSVAVVRDSEVDEQLMRRPLALEEHGLRAATGVVSDAQ